LRGKARKSDLRDNYVRGGAERFLNKGKITRKKKWGGSPSKGKEKRGDTEKRKGP